MNTVFITGASSGIGAACAEQFARSGARLLLAARRLERLEAMGPALRKTGASDIRSIRLDVRDPLQVQTVLGGLPDSWKSIDILVNNAGLSRGLDRLHEGDLQDWEEMIDTGRERLLRHQARGQGADRRAQDRPARYRRPGRQRRPGPGGYRVQPGALPWKREKGPGDLRRHDSPDRERRGGSGGFCRHPARSRPGGRNHPASRRSGRGDPRSPR